MSGIRGYRWRICALLFFATTINYIDRQIISLLAPYLSNLFHWSEQDYSLIITSFQIAYGLGMVISGTLLDAYGTRIGYIVAMAIWSFFSGIHACFSTIAGFCFARAGLGFGESANFPAAIKAVSEWFPKKERAFATGIFNSGSNLGAIVAPIVIPIITLRFGWQWAFIISGILGIIWLIFWIPLYKQPTYVTKLTQEEFYLIQQGNDENVKKTSFFEMLKRKDTIAFCFARLLTDPVWWFLLYWTPKFLNRNFDVQLSGLAGPLVLVYSAASFGSICGGWISSELIKRGGSVILSRKITILGICLSITPLYFVSMTTDISVAILLLCIGAACHQAWAANLFTLMSDIFPKDSVASIVGLSGLFGSIGGVLFSLITGKVLDLSGNYFYLFLFASFSYLISGTILFIFTGKEKGKK